MFGLSKTDQCLIKLLVLSFLSLFLLHAGWQSDRSLQRPVQDLCHLWRHPQDGEYLASCLEISSWFVTRVTACYLVPLKFQDEMCVLQRTVLDIFPHCKKTIITLQVVNACVGLVFLLKPFHPVGGVWWFNSQAGQDWRRCGQVSKVRLFHPHGKKPYSFSHWIWLQDNTRSTYFNASRDLKKYSSWNFFPLSVCKS